MFNDIAVDRGKSKKDDTFKHRLLLSPFNIFEHQREDIVWNSKRIPGRPADIIFAGDLISKLELIAPEKGSTATEGRKKRTTTTRQVSVDYTLFFMSLKIQGKGMWKRVKDKKRELLSIPTTASSLKEVLTYYTVYTDSSTSIFLSFPAFDLPVKG